MCNGEEVFKTGHVEISGRKELRSVPTVATVSTDATASTTIIYAPCHPEGGTIEGSFVSYGKDPSLTLRMTGCFLFAITQG